MSAVPALLKTLRSGGFSTYRERAALDREVDATLVPIDAIGGSIRGNRAQTKQQG